MTCRVDAGLGRSVAQPFEIVREGKFVHVLGDVVDAWRFEAGSGERMTMFPSWLTLPHVAGVEHGEVVLILFYRDRHEVVRLGEWLVHRHGQIEIVSSGQFEAVYKPRAPETGAAA